MCGTYADGIRWKDAQKMRSCTARARNRVLQSLGDQPTIRSDVSRLAPGDTWALSQSNTSDGATRLILLSMCFLEVLPTSSPMCENMMTDGSDKLTRTGCFRSHLGRIMPGFRDNSGGVTGWSAWKGDPDDDAAHQTILAWLQRAVTTGFLNPTDPLSNAVKGNLGEFIAYQIGEGYVFTNVEIAHAANAWDPLSRISRPDVDIVWLYFDSNESNDWAALQEVKTTGDASLSLAEGLIVDYEKLFGENPRLTLQTRLGALKNKLDQQGQGHLSPRITALGGPAPNRSHGIRIIPTLLHDSAYDSATKMAVVRQALIGQGWSTTVIDCWSIALGDLDNRLARLARGQQ